MIDLRIPLGNDIFAVRAAILCVHNGALLVQRDSRFPDFAFVPGGALLMGEETNAGAAREWREEMGTAAGELRLVGVVENFFAQSGRRWHEVGFYFLMQPPQLLPAEGSSALDHSRVTNHWIPLEDVPETRILPAVLDELLKVPAGEVRHILNRETAFADASQDLRLLVGEWHFQARAHLLYVQGGKLLTNTVPGSDFWFLPGGTVGLGEDSAQAALREWPEETGIPVKSARLLGLSEGFDTERKQQLGFCYLIESAQRLPMHDFPVRDHDQLVMHWVPLTEVERLPVHPLGLTRMLDAIAGEVVQITFH